MPSHSGLGYGAWSVAIVAALIAAAGVAAESAAPPRRPNIVFVMADDLGWTDLGCQGSTYYETPAIDRLATRGVRFTNHHHCQNCTPTRAALMSGQYPARTGVYTVGGVGRFDWSMRPLQPVPNHPQLPLDRETIADRLKAAGYATGLFGKWHIGDKGAHHPSARGFDEAIVTMGKHFDFPTSPKTDVPRGQYLADFLTDRAVDFIGRHSGRPFFLYVSHFAVHEPLDAKPKLVERFRAKPAADGHRNPVYAAMIASVDQSVGRIVRALEEHGLTDDTVLVFTSDNGGVGGYAREGLVKPGGAGHDITDNAPLRSGKGSLYEGGIRVPLVIRWPGVVPPGSACGVPTLHVDFFPTLLEIAGAGRPRQQLDGQSLVGLLRDPAASLDREAIFHHFPGYLGIGRNVWRTTPVSVVQAGDWKLHEYLEDGRVELYDLSRDIGERRNIAQAEPKRTADLRRMLAAWRADVSAPMPKANKQAAVIPVADVSDPKADFAEAVRLFFDAEPAAAARRFDLVAAALPAAEPELWQRGIALYYAGRFADGRRQFELHEKVNPNDVENPAWHFLCVARLEGVEAARRAMLPVGADPRVPMKEILDLFAGRGDAAAVLAAAELGPEETRRNQLCYAHLYLGLYAEALGDADAARRHIVAAAGRFRMDHYMGRVAVVHAQLRGWDVPEADAAD